MIMIDMEMPKECHECPMQKQFKDGKVDDFYMRRCVITGKVIEYPKPEWCPLKHLMLCANCKHWDSSYKCTEIGKSTFPQEYCSEWKKKD